MTEEIKEVKPKKKINSKAKGNSFELQIAKTLGDTLPPMKFKRSQSSGAILGGMNAKNLDSYSIEMKEMFVGDICSTNQADVIREAGWKFRYALECKFYKSVDTLDQIFNNTKIKGWFTQAMIDSQKINKEPLLIFKFNHTDIFCGTNANTLLNLPSTLTKKMTMQFDDGVTMHIFLFKEALLDTDWWKIKV